MDGWDAWTGSPPHVLDRELIGTAMDAARFKSRAAAEDWEDREVVWDAGMPQESREIVKRGDPRWPTADIIR